MAFSITFTCSFLLFSSVLISSFLMAPQSLNATSSSRKISVYYEDRDGFKKTKFYDFDEMMKRAWPDHVKVKAKFPRNTAGHFDMRKECK